MRTTKLRVFGGLAAAMLAGAATYAWAKGVSFNSLTPAEFVSSCEKMGGKVSRPGTGVIRCTLPSGTVVDCSWGNDGGGTICSWKGDLSTASIKKLMGDPSPNSVSPGTTSQPKATGTPGAGTVN
ncbi:MAG TPA: hypothetical protein PLR41_03320 [Alphaproteobacteria bacterium]|nr:hypothetical protein [Alphaproteobacteria bacterium]